MSTIIHSLSIQGDLFQLACGACSQVQEIKARDWTHLAGVRANSDIYECPRCESKSPLVFDRLDCAGVAHGTP